MKVRNEEQTILINGDPQLLRTELGFHILRKTIKKDDEIFLFSMENTKLHMEQRQIEDVSFKRMLDQFHEMFKLPSSLPSIRGK